MSSSVNLWKPTIPELGEVRIRAKELSLLGQ